MTNELLNTLILSALLLVTGAGGYFVTQRQQPTTLEQIESDIEALEAREAEVETLIAAEATASEEAAATLARWNTRYKVLPVDLSSAEVVAYLNALSAAGFERFDLSLTGVTSGETASYYTYQVTGSAYFESLFGFLWHLENGRGMYRVRDLSLKKQVTTLGARPPQGEDPGFPGRQVVLAEFAFAVDAYFSTNRDLSAPDSAVAPPPEAFPARRAAVNPFFPYILAELPPNSDDLVDVANDPLVGVIGSKAVFTRGGQLRELEAGDRVYLGRIASVDPNRARVVVDLNMGGVRERAELDLDTGERYRRALGGTTLAPARRREIPAGPTLDHAPAAPGTPGAADAVPVPSGPAADDIPRRPQNN